MRAGLVRRARTLQPVRARDADSNGAGSLSMRQDENIKHRHRFIEPVVNIGSDCVNVPLLPSKTVILEKKIATSVKSVHIWVKTGQNLVQAGLGGPGPARLYRARTQNRPQVPGGGGGTRGSG